jgi:hypothetical protein
VLPGVAVSVAALLSAAPAVAATSAAVPASNVHVGQVLAQIPHSGSHCKGTLSGQVHVSVDGTSADPDAYVAMTINSKCQMVVTKIAYGTAAAGTGGTSSTKAAPSAAAPAAAPASKPTTCAHETDAAVTVSSDFVELLAGTTYLNYRQHCNSGSNVAIYVAAVSENANTTYVGEVNGYRISIIGFTLRWAKPVGTEIVGNAQWNASGGGGSGVVQAIDTTKANGAVVANCYWTKSFQTQTGLSFGCQEHRDS